MFSDKIDTSCVFGLSTSSYIYQTPTVYCYIFISRICLKSDPCTLILNKKTYLFMRYSLIFTFFGASFFPAACAPISSYSQEPHYVRIFTRTWCFWYQWPLFAGEVEKILNKYNVKLIPKEQTISCLLGLYLVEVW